MLHDGKDIPLAEHQREYWALCIYLTGLNICLDFVYCGIETEGN